MSIPPGTDLCSIPAGPVPDGVTPNFIDPPDLSGATLAVGAVLTVLSTVLVVGRLWNSWGRFKFVDYLTIVGFILSCSYTGIVMAMHKLTRHAWDLPACWYIADYTWKLLFSQNLLLGITQFTTKSAVLFLYLQLFATGKMTRHAITAGIILMGALYLPHPILCAVYMTPHSDESWADLATDGRPQKISFYAPVHGVGSIVLDTYIFVIPILVLRKLQVSRKKKLQLLSVFTVALCGIISSVASCAWRFIVLFGSSGDFTWQQGNLFIWILVEHNVALIVGCMPGFAGLIKTRGSTSVLYRTLLSRIRRGTGSGSGGGGGGGGSSSYGSGASSQPKLPGPYRALARGKPKEARRGRAYFYEMGDSTLARETQVTTAAAAHDDQGAAGRPMAEDEQGILRTTDVAQSYERPLT